MRVGASGMTVWFSVIPGSIRNPGVCLLVIPDSIRNPGVWCPASPEVVYWILDQVQDDVGGFRMAVQGLRDDGRGWFRMTVQGGQDDGGGGLPGNCRSQPEMLYKGEEVAI